MGDKILNIFCFELFESDTITLLEIMPTYHLAGIALSSEHFGHNATQTALDPEQISSSSQKSDSQKMVINEIFFMENITKNIIVAHIFC